MKLAIANLVVAALVLIGVAYGIADMRHSALCSRAAVTIIDGWTHNISHTTLDTLIQQFWEAC